MACQWCNSHVGGVFEGLDIWICSIMSERKRRVSALLDSTPFLLEAVLVKRFIRGRDVGSGGGGGGNEGVIQLLYQFCSLLAWKYDYKW